MGRTTARRVRKKRSRYGTNRRQLDSNDNLPPSFVIMIIIIIVATIHHEEGNYANENNDAKIETRDEEKPSTSLELLFFLSFLLFHFGKPCRWCRADILIQRRPRCQTSSADNESPMCLVHVNPLIYRDFGVFRMGCAKKASCYLLRFRHGTTSLSLSLSFNFQTTGIGNAWPNRYSARSIFIAQHLQQFHIKFVENSRLPAHININIFFGYLHR